MSTNSPAMPEAWLRTLLSASSKEASTSPFFFIIEKAENSRTSQRLYEKFTEQKIKLRRIELKVLLVHLENIEKESSSEMISLWDNLFLSAIDEKFDLKLVSLPYILMQLTPNEVKIMLEIQKEHRIKIDNYLTLSSYLEKISMSWEEIENLTRLHLIAEIIDYKFDPQDGDRHNQTRVENKEEGKYKLTFLGKKFLNACFRKH
ncbi:hypothetical protein [Dyadobacter sp. CY356]|uniref:Abi-alpha family protein n=1 Tax=Dyadobacter sp. CY356 TaxID=2906442 RepID=UPI001F470CE1|nr:hypothetical protein [Dyadobacter sp. CY356]MCF0055542.1 hypothetical protein [Dyadobacter sp. CY356]